MVLEELQALPILASHVFHPRQENAGLLHCLEQTNHNNFFQGHESQECTSLLLTHHVISPIRCHPQCPAMFGAINHLLYGNSSSFGFDVAWIGLDPAGALC